MQLIGLVQLNNNNNKQPLNTINRIIINYYLNNYEKLMK